MRRYRRSSYQYYTTDDRPMLGPAEDVLEETKSSHNLENDDLDYDPETEAESKRILEAFSDLLSKSSEPTVEERDSSNDNHQNDSSNTWYKRKIDIKIKEVNDRLDILSNMVSNVCPVVAEHIRRVEQDHRGMTFCQMDYPRHPSLNKPWTNSWKFNCVIKCKESATHRHTDGCQSKVVLEHVDTGVSIESPNICANEYPAFVMDTVKLFQDFANEDMIKIPFSDVQGAPEISLWTGIKLVVRSNYKNELMIVVRGKRLHPIKNRLRNYFDKGPGRYSNVMSVSILDQGWSKNINKIEPERIIGFYKLTDKIGPILIEYKPKVSVDFNAIETAQLGQIIKDYADLTMETALIDIGCGFGVTSLMMANECERVFGLNTMHAVTNDLKQAEEIKKLNGIENASFIGCNPEDLITRCSAYLKGYITVAVLNLTTPYGKSKYTMDALRNIPSIWKVIVYGSFTKDYRQNIMKLIIHDKSQGDNFLPMRGCILDKSLSAENAFDIVMLFERTSLITPSKVEVLASGPSMNVKIDSEAGIYEPLPAEESKPKVLVDRNQNLQNSEEKYRNSAPYSSSSSRSSRKNRSPSPRRSHRSPSPRRSHRSPSPRRSHRSPSPRRSHRSPSPRRSHRSPSSRRSRRSPSPTRHTHKNSDRSVHRHKSHSSNGNEFRIKNEPTEDRLPPPRNKNQSPPLSWSVPDENNHLEIQNDQRLHEETREQPPPVSYPSLSIRKEFLFSCPSPPRERPPTPPMDTSLHIDGTQIEEENGWKIPSWTTVVTEPEEEESTLNSNNDQVSDNSVNVPASSLNVNFEDIPLPMIIKSEPMDSHGVPAQFETSENIPLPPIIKSEPVDHYEVPSPVVADENDVPPPMTVNSEPVDHQDVPTQLETGENVPVPVKSEPVDSQELRDENSSQPVTDQTSPLSPCQDIPQVIKFEPMDTFKVPIKPVKSEPQDLSPNRQDFHTMETPVHTPRPVSSSSNSIFANLDGFEFSLDATKSYMTSTRDPEPPNATIHVKTESAEKEQETSNEQVDAEASEQGTEKSIHNSIKTELEEGEHETDEEIKIVDEKRINGKANESVVKTEPKDDEVEIIAEKKSEQQSESSAKIRVKTEDELKVKSETEELDDDLRTLIEQRKKLLEKLKKDKEPRIQKELPRSYKRHSSRSPSSRSSRKHNRSPSSSSRRSARSPSSHRHRSPNNKRRRRSSPYRSRRSPASNYSRRSPTPPVRIKRERHSPDRRGDRRSPSTSSYKRDTHGRTSPGRSSYNRRKRSRSKSPKRRKSKSPSKKLEK